MKITLCTPTRGRADRFEEMVRSARLTAARLDDVEVVGWRDEEDTSGYLTRGVTWGQGPRPMVDGHLQMAGLWSKAWELGTGDVAMMCADDVIFETPDWDREVSAAFASVPDRIVMVSTANGQDDRPLLPFVSREWIDAAGFVPDDLQGWFADEWIWSIAADLGRVIFLPDVMIRHNQSGGDPTYYDGQRERQRLGGLDGMRRNFYSIPMVERRDAAADKLRSEMQLGWGLQMAEPPWMLDACAGNARARRHASLMREQTLVVVHCYKGDRDVVRNALPQFLHHGAPVLVLSPSDSPVRFRRKGVECRQAGRAAYFGQTSLDRQREHLELLLEYPQDYFLLNDADSLCLSPTIPRYLYESDDVVWSNEVPEWRPHASPYPKIAMQPPYFLTRRSIERMLSVADRVKAHPITPYIDWYMLALACEAGLTHRSFPDGASFPAWQRSDIAETQVLGHNPKHINDPNGRFHGEWMMADKVRLGAVLIHSVKHPEVLKELLVAHAEYVRRGSPPPNTITLEEYVARQMDPMVVREGPGGFVEGESIRV